MSKTFRVQGYIRNIARIIILDCSDNVFRFYNYKTAFQITKANDYVKSMRNIKRQGQAVMKVYIFVAIYRLHYDSFFFSK